MQKLLAVLLSIATFLTALSVSRNTVKAPEDMEDFVPVVRFAVMSDTHIHYVTDVRTKRIQRVLTMAYDDAQRDPNYKTVDAAIFAGDLTDDGRADQFIGFKAAVDSVLQPQTRFMAVVAKSHDGNTMQKGSLSFFESLTGDPTDYHYEIRGFHFIGLSASKTAGEHYSAYQRAWLREQLDIAASDDPNKPIFVTHHEHVLDTVYGSSAFDGWGMDDFKDILSAYPQIVDFSGHSHYPLNDPRSIWQGDFTAVGTGAVYYAELTVDKDRCVHPNDYRQIAQAWIVEVDQKNSVRLRGFDALSGTQLCSYTIHDPANANAREFTDAQQRAESSAPVFDKNAAVSARKLFGGYSVSVPAAESTDGKIVFVYRVRVTGADGEEKTAQYLVNNYWKADTYKTVSFRVSAQKGDTITVTAENAYGMQSQPLTTVIR